MSTMSMSTLQERGDGQPQGRATRAVRSGCDGLYLRYNPAVLGTQYRAAAQHLRGVRRSAVPGHVIGQWTIGGHPQDVVYHDTKGEVVEFTVRSTEGLEPFLLTVRARRVGGFGFGAISLHVHPALIRRLGTERAVASGRAWVNHLALCLPSDELVKQCERVSRCDVAADVLVAWEGADDLTPAAYQQVCSPYKNPQPWGSAGWEVGLSGRRKYAERVAVVCYDKLTERRDKHGREGVCAYLSTTHAAGLRVDSDGGVRQDGQQMRIWRVEARFHRQYLHEHGLQNADDVLPQMEKLFETACQTTVMRERSRTGQVYRANPVTHFWQSVQQASHSLSSHNSVT